MIARTEFALTDQINNQVPCEEYSLHRHFAMSTGKVLQSPVKNTRFTGDSVFQANILLYVAALR